MPKKTILKILFLFFVMRPFPVFSAAAANADLSVFPVGVLVNSETHRGKSIVEAVKLAAQELKVYKTKSKPGFEIKLFIEDTKGDSQVALSKLEGFSADGIQTVIGPQSSDEAQALLGFAKKKNMLLVSPSSTDVKLARPGDNLLRFCPDETVQAKAIAELMAHDGVRSAVVVYRHDEWGQNVALAIKKNFLDQKGSVAGMIPYDPASENFSKVAALVLTSVSSASEKHGKDATAVVFLGFGEVTDIFYAAKRFTVLERVKWYGSDANALSPKMVRDSDTAGFAVQTNYRTPVFGQNISNASYRTVKARLRARLGQDPDVYALAAYDALRVVAKAFHQAGNTDLKKFMQNVEQVASSYEGVTGSLALNKTGDRAHSIYGFWTVSRAGGSHVWKPVSQ